MLFAWGEPNSELILHVRWFSAENPGPMEGLRKDLSWNSTKKLCLGSWVLTPGVWAPCTVVPKAVAISQLLESALLP